MRFTIKDWCGAGCKGRSRWRIIARIKIVSQRYVFWSRWRRRLILTVWEASRKFLRVTRHTGRADALHRHGPSEKFCALGKNFNARQLELREVKNLVESGSFLDTGKG